MDIENTKIVDVSVEENEKLVSFHDFIDWLCGFAEDSHANVDIMLLFFLNCLENKDHLEDIKKILNTKKGIVFFTDIFVKKTDFARVFIRNDGLRLFETDFVIEPEDPTYIGEKTSYRTLFLEKIANVYPVELVLFQDNEFFNADSVGTYYGFCIERNKDTEYYENQISILHRHFTAFFNMKSTFDIKEIRRFGIFLEKSASYFLLSRIREEDVIVSIKSKAVLDSLVQFGKLFSERADALFDLLARWNPEEVELPPAMMLVLLNSLLQSNALKNDVNFEVFFKYVLPNLIQDLDLISKQTESLNFNTIFNLFDVVVGLHALESEFGRSEEGIYSLFGDVVVLTRKNQPYGTVLGMKTVLEVLKDRFHNGFTPKEKYEMSVISEKPLIFKDSKYGGSALVQIEKLESILDNLDHFDALQFVLAMPYSLPDVVVREYLLPSYIKYVDTFGAKNYYKDWWPEMKHVIHADEYREITNKNNAHWVEFRFQPVFKSITASIIPWMYGEFLESFEAGKEEYPKNFDIRLKNKLREVFLDHDFSENELYMIFKYKGITDFLYAFNNYKKYVKDYSSAEQWLQIMVWEFEKVMHQANNALENVN